MEPESEIKLAEKKRKIRQRAIMPGSARLRSTRRSAGKQRAIFELIMSDRFTLTFIFLLVGWLAGWLTGRLAASPAAG